MSSYHNKRAAYKYGGLAEWSKAIEYVSLHTINPPTSTNNSNS